MPRFSVSDVQTVLEKTGLFFKYPFINNNKTICVNQMWAKIWHGSYYQRTATRFLTLMNRYARDTKWGSTSLTLTEFIDNKCTNDLYKFKIYHDHDINDFNILTFVTNFYGESVDTILNVFTYFNMSSNILNGVKQQVEMYQSVVKIFNIHLLMTLAEIFAEFDFGITHNYYPFFHCQLMNGIKGCLRKKKDITEHHNFNYIITHFYDGISSTNNFSDEDTIQYSKNMFKTIKIMHNFFEPLKQLELELYIASIPDLEALLRKKIKSPISKINILNNLVTKKYLWIYNIIDKNSISEQENETIDDLIQPMPVQINNEALIIEV
jgi:hypothetical protein